MATNVIVLARPVVPGMQASMQLTKGARDRSLIWPVVHGPLFAKPHEVPGPQGEKTYFASRVSVAFRKNPLTETIRDGSNFSYVLSIGSSVFKAEVYSEVIRTVHLAKGKFAVLETPASQLLEANQLLLMAIKNALSNWKVEKLSANDQLPPFVEGFGGRHISYSGSVLLVVPRSLNPSEGFKTYATFLRQAAEFASGLKLPMRESADTEGWSDRFGVGVHA